MNAFYKIIVVLVLVAGAPTAFALTEQETLTKLGQLELRAELLDIKATQVAGGSTQWDKRFILEEWSVVMSEAQKVQNAIAAITPICEPFAPQTQTLACPSGQDGNITQTRISTCPGPSWSEWTTTANNCAPKPVPVPAATIVLPTQEPVILRAPAPVVMLGGTAPPTLAQGQQSPPTTTAPPATSPVTTPPPAQQPPAQPPSTGGGGIVPCGIDGNTQTYTVGGKTHTYAEPCTFEHFLIGINNVINFLIMITGSVAAIVFAIAGLLILTAGTNEGQVTKAKEMFWSVLKGFVWILSAWLLVKTVLAGLGVPAAFSLLEN